jgi:hypothetical protein
MSKDSRSQLAMLVGWAKGIANRQPRSVDLLDEPMAHKGRNLGEDRPLIPDTSRKLCSYEVSSGTRPAKAALREYWDLSSLVVGLGGLEPPTSSLSGFSTRLCLRRIAPATWANDVPLETVANRSAPMACGPNVDQARPAWAIAL